MNRCGAPRRDASDLQSAPLSLSLGALALLGERHPASADESRGEFGEDRQNPRAAECGPAHGRGVEHVAFDQLLVERLTRAGAVDAFNPCGFGRRSAAPTENAIGCTSGGSSSLGRAATMDNAGLEAFRPIVARPSVTTSASVIPPTR